LSLHDLAMAQAAATIRSAPCWTVMVCFEQPVGRANVVDGPGAIIAAVRSGSKPGRTHQECWVVQASSDWSRRHLEASREEVAARLLREFADLCGGTVPPPRFAKAHRWRYARPTGAPGAYLWNDDLRLGACGDWCLGSTVEDAWLSGNGLGGHVASTFPASGGAALP
jgi:predicted NAD/FAD-dependent oxidoreductase